MGLKLNNRQLKLLTELTLEASRTTPDQDLDELLNRMIAMCRFRGMSITWKGNSKGDVHDIAGVALKAAKERRVRKQEGVHPLFKDTA